MEPIIDRYLQVARRPTMTGLALALGLASHQVLLNYKRYGEEFRHTVLVARPRMECHYEQLLLQAVPGRSLSRPASIIKSMPMGLTFITAPPAFHRLTFHPENQGELP